MGVIERSDPAPIQLPWSRSPHFTVLRYLHTYSRAIVSENWRLCYAKRRSGGCKADNSGRPSSLYSVTHITFFKLDENAMTTIHMKPATATRHFARLLALSAIGAAPSIAYGSEINAGLYPFIAVNDCTPSNLPSVGAGSENVAIGCGSSAANGSWSIGGSAVSNGLRAFAMGYESQALGVSTFALGDRAKATADYATAFGFNTNASGLRATAIGANSSATERQSLALGNGANSTAAVSTAIGNNSSASAERATAIGNSAKATGFSSTSIGSLSQASGASSTAIGDSSQANANLSMAMGQGARTDDTGSVSIGERARVGGTASDATNAIAIGSQALVGGSDALLTGAIAIGERATVGGDDSEATAAIALGQASSSSEAGAVALGSGAVANRAGMQGALESFSGVAVSSSQGAISVGASGLERQITNVAGGTSATDAVNVRQLSSVAGNLATSLGSGAQFAAGTGTFVAPNYAIQGSNYDNVGGALGALDTKVTENRDNISTLSDRVDQAVIYDDGTKSSVRLGGSSAVAPVRLRNVAEGTDDTDAVNLKQLKDAGLVDGGGSTLDAVTYQSGSNRTLISFSGAQGTLLTNVASGSIAIGSLDAVNGGQLAGLRDAIQGQLTNLTSSITGLDARVTVLEGSTGGAQPPYVGAKPNAGNGSDAVADGTGSAAYGYGSTASGTDSTALGQASTASGSGSTAVGASSIAAGAGDTALGSNAKVLADQGTAVGANTTIAAGAAGSVAVGEGSTVMAGKGTAVGQGSAVRASASNAVALGSGSVADRANSVSVGSAGNERQITNVAPGTNSTDAVNVQQLRQSESGVLEQAREYTDRRDEWLEASIDRANRQANRGIASASALVNNMPYLPGKTTVNLGTAFYRGESALGMGVSRWSGNGRLNVNAGVSAARGDKPIVRFGVGMVFGD